jgi:hypothetical protein
MESEKKSQNEPFSNQTKFAARYRQYGKCAYCSKPLLENWRIVPKSDDEDLTENAHHGIPDQASGKEWTDGKPLNQLDNCIMLHEDCHLYGAHGGDLRNGGMRDHAEFKYLKPERDVYTSVAYLDGKPETLRSADGKAAYCNAFKVDPTNSNWESNLDAAMGDEFSRYPTRTQNKVQRIEREVAGRRMGAEGRSSNATPDHTPPRMPDDGNPPSPTQSRDSSAKSHSSSFGHGPQNSGSPRRGRGTTSAMKNEASNLGKSSQVAASPAAAGRGKSR